MCAHHYDNTRTRVFNFHPKKNHMFVYVSTQFYESFCFDVRKQDDANEESKNHMQNYKERLCIFEDFFDNSQFARAYTKKIHVLKYERRK